MMTAALVTTPALLRDAADDRLAAVAPPATARGSG